MVHTQVTKEELLEKAKKPAEDAMRLHAFYRGKMQTALRCQVRDLHDFAITRIRPTNTPTSGIPWPS